MILLTKDNITEYLKGHMPYLDYSKPLTISEIGEGSIEEDGDGYINYVFRVSDGNYKLIVKQSRQQGRIVRFIELPLNRGELEYESMKMRSAIVPQYIPRLYFCDKANHVFVTEDVSHLSIMRFALNKNIIFPKFARQAAEYLAKTHFYTSEYYLDTKTFRDLTIHFMNHGMRDIFDSHGFMFKEFPAQSIGGDLDPRYIEYVENLSLDPRVIMERKRLRHAYISKAEVFIHGDFHTSNTFIDQDEMKVIDMEYTFAGPQSYDIGYMEGQLLGQYISANFRDFPSEDARREFKTYIMSCIKNLYVFYLDEFFACWDEDAKDFYRDDTLLKESMKRDLLQEMAGFCANTNISRTAGDIGFPEYDMLNDHIKESHAICLSVLIDAQVLQNRHEYKNIYDFMHDIMEIERVYMSNLS